MSSVDDRIVKLEFDNKSFEDKIKQSQESLQQFETLLKSADGTNALTSMSEAVGHLESRFSLLGVASMTVISKITSGAMDAVGKVMGTVSSAIIEGGKRRALNFEQARFMLNGMFDDAKIVESIMASANEAVKGTAYGYDEAARAASQLAASNVQAGDDMTSSLRAIAGTAAMTGASYTDIANIFTTVAGNGKLMTQQLRQFSFRGLNAAATLAAQLGKTEEEIYELVSKGKIGFKEFSDAMDAAYGEHAKKANETFTGSLSNMKAALARIGQELYYDADKSQGLLFNLRDIFNSITPVIDTIHEALKPMFSTLREGMANATTRITDFINSVGSSLESGEGFGVFDRILTIISNLTSALAEFGRFLSSGLGSIFSELGLAGESFFEIFLSFLEKGSAGLRTFAEQLNNVTDDSPVAVKVIRTVADAFTTVSRAIIRGVRVAIRVVEGVLSAAKAAYQEYVQPIIDPILASLESFFSKVTEYIKDFGASTGDVFSPIVDKVKSFASAMLDTEDPWATIKSYFKSFSEWIEKHIPGITGALTAFGTGIANTFGEGSVIGNAAKDIFTLFGDVMSGVFEVLGQIDLRGAIGEILAILGDIGKAGLEAIPEILRVFGKAFREVGGIILDAGGVFAEGLGLIASGISNFIKNLDLRTVAEIIGILIAFNVNKLIKNFSKIGDVFGSLSKMFDKIGDSFTNPFENLGKEKKSTTILKYAAAIAIMAGSLSMLSKIDTESLVKSGVALGSIAAMLAGSTIAIDKFSGNGKSLRKVSKYFLSLAITVSIISSAMSRIGSMDKGEIIKAGTTITALVGVLTLSSVLMAKMTDKGSKFASFTSLIGMALSIKILAGVIEQLGNLDEGAIRQGGIAIAAMAAGLTLFVGSLAVINKLGDLGGVGSKLILIAASLGILSLTIASLSEIPIDGLKAGATAIAAVMGALVLFVAGLAIVNSVGDLGGVGIKLIAIAVALGILSLAIKGLSEIPLDGLANAGIAFGALMVAIIAIGAVVGMLPPLSAGLLAFGASVLLVGAGIALAGAGFEKFATNIQTLIDACSAENGSRLGEFLTAISESMESINVGSIVAASVGLIALGLGLVGVGAGFALASSGFAEFESAGGVSALIKLITELSNADGLGIAVVAGGLLALGAAGLIAGGGLIVLAAGVALANAANLGKFVADISNLTGFDLIGAAAGISAIGLAGIVAGVGLVAVGAGATVGGAGLTVLGAGATVAGFGAITLASGLLMLHTSLSICISSMISAGKAIIDGLVAGISAGVGALKDFGSLVYDNLVSPLLSALGINSPSKVTQEAGENVVEGLVLGLTGGMGDIEGVSKEMAETLIGGFDGLPEGIGEISDETLKEITDQFSSASPKMQTSGSELFSYLGTGMSSASGIPTGQAQGLMSNLTGVIGGSGASFFGSGSDIGTNVASGLASTAGKSSTNASNMVSKVMTAVTGATGKMLQAGQAYSQNLANGIQGAAGRAGVAARNMGSGAVNSARSGSGGAYGVGSSISGGVGSGIYGNQSAAINAAASMARNALAAAKRALNINSPSRVFRDEVGKNVVLGFAKGVNMYSGLAEQSIEDMTRSSISAATEFANRVNTAVEDSLNSRPVISPVLDLSDVRSRSALLSSMLGGGSARALGQAGSVSSVRAASAAALLGNANVINNNTTLNVTQQSGESTEAFADRVVMKLNMANNLEG